MLTLSRRGLLASAGALGGLGGLGALGLARAAAPAGADRKLIVILATGGWDVTFALDPKLGVAEVDGPMPDVDTENPDDREEVLSFGDMSVLANPFKRPEVGRLFEAYGNRLCVVNGIWVGNVAHHYARGRVISGTTDGRSPDLATIVGVASGLDLPLVTADLSGLGRVGPYADRTALFGRHGQFAALVDPQHRMFATHDDEYRPYGLDPEDRAALDDFLTTRVATDPRGSVRDGDRLLAAQQESLTRAQQLFGLQMERGSLDDLEGQLEVALQLLESDVCRTVTVESSPSFDTHTDQPNQHPRWDSLCFNIRRLIDMLDQRGLSDQITVAVLSEFGRLPKRNVDGGTDHFPHTSAMMFGRGIVGGRILGGTNDLVQSLPVDFETGELGGETFLRPENLVAALMETLDVDPGEWLPGIAPFRAIQS
jgi:hypothetical protein